MQRFFIIAHKISPAISVVEVFLQLRKFQICARKKCFAQHALRLLQILRFSDAKETRLKVQSSLISFSSAWSRVMMIFRIQKSFYCDRHSQSREAKKQNTFTRTIILSSMKNNYHDSFPLLCERFTSERST